MSINKQSSEIPKEAFRNEGSAGDSRPPETTATGSLPGDTLPTEPLSARNSTTLPYPTEPLPSATTVPTQPLPPTNLGSITSPWPMTEAAHAEEAPDQAATPSTPANPPTQATTTASGAGTNTTRVARAERPRIRLASLFVGMIFVAVGLTTRLVLPNPGVRHTFTTWVERLQTGDWIVAWVLILGLIAIIGALAAASRNRSRNRW